MRRLLLTLAPVLLAGCARESPAPARAGGGTLVIATPGDADVLLPPVTATQLGVHVADLLFPKLAHLRLDLNTVDDAGFAPALAERWERLDSLTLLFHLDRRARWADGAPITADDVVFTFQVYTDPRTASPFRPLLEPLATVERADAHAVRVRFRRRYPEQLYDATHHLRVLPRHLLDTIPREALAASRFAHEPVGAGPYRLARWTRGAEIVLEADTAFFLGRPNLDRLIWRVLPDVSTAVSALLAGEADAMEVIPQREAIERVQRAPRLRLEPYPSPFVAGILFNVRRPPFGERAVRRAIAMALDRATIVRNVFGPYGEVPVGSTSRTQWIARAAVPQLPHDTVAAARLLDSLGWRDGDGDGIRERAGRPLRFALLVPTTSQVRQQAAVLVQDQLRRIGVDLRIQTLEFGVFDGRTRAGNFDAMFFSWTLDPSPSVLAQFWASDGPDNRGGYRDPAFDSLFAAAVSARSRDEALPRWARVLAHLNEDAPAVFLFSPRNQAAVSTRLADVTIRPDNWLATVATWRAAPEPGPR